MKTNFLLNKLFSLLFIPLIFFSFEIFGQPTITDVTPTSGSYLGGDVITINGTNFTPTSTVFFGPAPAASVTFINSTTLQATTPANVPIVVNITVVDGLNTSPISQEDRFAFTGFWRSFIPDFLSNDAFVINTSTKAILPPSVPVGGAPNDVVTTETGNTAYTLNSGGSSLTPIDVLTQIPSSDINVGSGFPILEAITFNTTLGPSGQYLMYTADLSSNTVTEINLSIPPPNTRTFNVGIQPCSVIANRMINPQTILVANLASSSISVIDLVTPGNPITTIPTGPGSQPSYIALMPDGLSAYFMDSNTSQNSVRNLVGVNTLTPSLGAVTLTSPDFSFNTGEFIPQMAISSDGTRGYVTNCNGSTITTLNDLNTLTPSVGCSIVVQNQPNGIAITPDGKDVYVSNGNSSSVTIVPNLPTCLPSVTNLVVGNRPTDPCITPDQAPLANFTASTSGLTVTFDASPSVSPVGTIVNYQWDFGDATTGSGQITSHTYAIPGLYTVTLTVTNSAGTSDSSTTVYNGKMMVRNGGPTAIYSLQVNPQPPVEIPTITTVVSSENPSDVGDPVTFTATVISIGGPVTTGTIQFVVDGVPFGSPIPVNGLGQAAITISNLTGTDGGPPHSIVANFHDSSNTFQDSSGFVLQVVNLIPTITTIISDINPSVYGQTITFTATVVNAITLAPVTSGVVQFIDHINMISDIIGTGNLNASGIATFTTSTPYLVVGNHPMEANYLGDSNNAPSRSGPPYYIQVITPAPTTTLLVSTPNPSTFPNNPTFIAQVTTNSPGGGIPTGVVEFLIDGVSQGFGSIDPNSGVAQFFPLSPIPVGLHVITANYVNFDGNYLFSTDSIIQEVDPTPASPTTTTLVLNNDPSIYGQIVTFTATVLDENSMPVANVPVRFIDYFDLSNPVLLGTVQTDANGIATFSTSTLLPNYLAVGNHPIVASFEGNPSLGGSSSDVEDQLVLQAPTDTTLTSSNNPNTYGSTTTFTATVTTSSGGGPPTGSVQFFDGPNLVATVSLVGGVAQYTPPATIFNVGNSTWTAVYSGDENFDTSQDSLIQNTIQATPTITVTSAPNPSVFGTPVLVTATVSPVGSGVTPTGTITFTSSDGSLNAVVPLVNGVATISNSNFAVGADTITAVYSGDSNYVSVTGTTVQNVIVSPTTTTLTSSNNPNVYGTTTTFTATVTPSSGGPATGSVQFFDGPNLIATVPLVGGVAQFTPPASIFSVGNSTWTAVYSGDVDFGPSQDSLIQNTIQATPTITVTSAPNPSVFGSPVLVTATVFPVGSGVTPTGTITFTSSDGSLNAVVPLVNGVATISNSNFAIGADTITAVYSGDTNYVSVTGTTVQNVNLIPTTTTVTSSMNPAEFGTTITFTATVTNNSGAGTPTGSITFIIDGVAQPPVLMDNGQATFSTASLSVGQHTIVAVYSGDATHLPSTSETLIQIITNFIPPPPPVLVVFPPTDLCAFQIKNEFATQTEFANILTWRAPILGSTPVSYRIYRDRDLGHFVGVVFVRPGEQTFEFTDHNRRPNRDYRYFVVSVDEFGNVSTPAEVELYRGS